MKNEEKILRIFGDSILKGIIYDADEGRYHLLKENGFKRMEEALSLKVDSKAMFGCTVTKGKQLLERTLKKNPSPSLVLIEFGGNDCDFLWDEVSTNPEAQHFPKTPLNIFSKTLKSMLDIVSSFQAIPILMSLPPIDGELYFNHICKHGGDGEKILQWLKDVKNIEKFQECYSNEVVKIAQETNTQLIDVRGAFGGHEEFLCEDGIHLNEEGHSLMIESLISRLIA